MTLMPKLLPILPPRMPADELQRVIAELNKIVV
jgi:hypothetical protein